MIPKLVAVIGFVVLFSTLLFANSVSPEHWSVATAVHPSAANFTQPTGQGYQLSAPLRPVIYRDTILSWDDLGILVFRGGDRGLFVWQMQRYRGIHGRDGRGRPKNDPAPTSVPDGDSPIALLFTTVAAVALLRWRSRQA